MSATSTKALSPTIVAGLSSSLPRLGPISTMMDDTTAARMAMRLSVSTAMARHRKASRYLRWCTANGTSKANTKLKLPSKLDSEFRKS